MSERSKAVPDFLLMIAYVCPDCNIVIPDVRVRKAGA